MATLRFDCDGTSYRDANGRTLIFGVNNFQVISTETEPHPEFANSSDVRLALSNFGTAAGLELPLPLQLPVLRPTLDLLEAFPHGRISSSAHSSHSDETRRVCASVEQSWPCGQRFDGTQRVSLRIPGDVSGSQQRALFPFAGTRTHNARAYGPSSRSGLWKEATAFFNRT